MVLKGSVPDSWQFDYSTTDDKSTKIYYLHKSGKRSSFRILNDILKYEVRDWELNQILN
jgi:hypothetical protein